MIVWWVFFSNYFPREVDSLHCTEELAKSRAEELGGDWDFEEVPVKEP